MRIVELNSLMLNLKANCVHKLCN